MVSIFFLMRSSIPFLAKFDKLEIFLKKAKYAYTINKHINMLLFARKDRNKEKRAILIERKRKICKRYH